MNYFSLFELPISFALDVNQLTTTFQDLQRQCHPDRFVNGSEAERLAASQQAAEINGAYQTLKHPLKRAEYLLALQGVDISNEQHTLKDIAFLTEQLTLGEELEQLSHRVDNEAELALFMQRLADMYQQRMQRMIIGLEQQQWPLVADELRKLRFLQNIQQHAEQLEERLLGY